MGGQHSATLARHPTRNVSSRKTANLARGAVEILFRLHRLDRRYGAFSHNRFVTERRRAWRSSEVTRCPNSWPANCETSILPEHDRGHPAGHQRHRRGHEAVDETVLARIGGDELLEADLVDFERGFGARHQRAV